MSPAAPTQREERISDRNDLEQVGLHLRKAIQCLNDHFDHGASAWPYVVSEQEPTLRPYSFSTNAMTTFALAAAAGLCETATLLPCVEVGYRNNYSDYIDRSVVDRAARKVVTECQRLRRRKNKSLTSSTSFGDDDPFTISWLLGLKSLIVDIDAIDGATWEKNLRRASVTLVDRVARQPSLHPVLQIKTSYQHAFPLLRVVHISNGLASDRNNGRSKLISFFRNRLHEYLSYFLTNNSRFDAAELVFSLEAMLQLDPDSLDEQTVEQAFAVVAQSQKRNLNWRPLRPFIADDRGSATLPLSVEIASSLLRICSLLDKRRPNGRYFSRYLHLFRTFTGWLFSSTTHGRATNGRDYFGWCSEHVYEPAKVHVWQTSQVVLYCVFYRALLARHSAMESLRAARLDVPRAVARDGAATSGNAWTYWTHSVQSREPIRAASGRFRVYQDIGTNFIRPRAEGVGASPECAWSMILYGPPGTGKTALAEQVAATLNWPLLAISPSDFVAEGEGRVEERAKDIFEAVRELADCVILFDEIDRLILDRDSHLYERQSDVFQFMTPGMLTKIHDLRAKQRSIFIIGTNYFERIDPAIKRVGRIDRTYPLMPPDVQQRTTILKNLLHRNNRRIRMDEQVLAQLMYHSTFAELKQFVKSLPPKVVVPRARDLAVEMHSQRSIRLLNYRSRFLFSNPELPTVQEPYEEFLILIFLLIDAGIDLMKLPKREVDFLRAFVAELSVGDRTRKKNLEARLAQYLPGCPPLQNVLLVSLSELG